MALTREQLWEGQRRLQRLLPDALLEADRMAACGNVPITGSPLAEAAAPYAFVDNFRALVIYPAPLGGYHCDLLFKTVPPGVSNTMGSPVARPFPSKFEAEEYATGLLACVIALGRQVGDGLTAGPPSFLLHEAAVRLPADVLTKMRAWLDERGDHDIRKADAERGLETTLRELGLAENCTTEDLDTMTVERKVRLMAALLAAAMCGVFVWPLRKDEAPQEGRTASIQLEPGETAAEGLRRMNRS